MELTLSFLMAAFALTGSPGPNTLSVAAVGASFGRVRGLGYMLGLNLGMVIVIAIVGSGLAGAVFAIPILAQIATVLAVIYFLYLAFKIATAPPLTQDTQETASKPPRWYEGVVLSLVNPKAYAAMTALFSGSVLVESSVVTDTVWKAILVLTTICTVNLIWLFVGASMTKMLQNHRTARAINIGFAILLLLSVAFATLS